MSIAEFLQAEAFRLGFLLAGVAPVIEPPHLKVYERWIEADMHAEMGYLASERNRQRRANPQLILPQARSLLVAALRYPDPRSISQPEDGDGFGRVASYAWGLDYHEILLPLMTELADLLAKYLGLEITSREYTDTGAILERDFGMLAGLGWIGKNTCLISPRHGSYFLLGESFLSAEIEPSVPVQTDFCGSCTRCIDACPTACIRPDRTIDARRCISYQTIENKGSIPPDLRSQTGSWVFGCDICQMVCPWNIRFSSPEGHPSLEPQAEIARPDL